MNVKTCFLGKKKIYIIDVSAELAKRVVKVRVLQGLYTDNFWAPHSDNFVY